MAGIDNVNGLLVALVSCRVFGVPFVYEMPVSSMRSSDAVAGDPVASTKVKPGSYVVESGTRFFFVVSVNPHSLLHLSLVTINRSFSQNAQHNIV